MRSFFFRAHASQKQTMRDTVQTVYGIVGTVFNRMEEVSGLYPATKRVAFLTNSKNGYTKYAEQLKAHHKLYWHSYTAFNHQELVAKLNELYYGTWNNRNGLDIRVDKDGNAYKPKDENIFFLEMLYWMCVQNGYTRHEHLENKLTRRGNPHPDWVRIPLSVQHVGDNVTVSWDEAGNVVSVGDEDTVGGDYADRKSSMDPRWKTILTAPNSYGSDDESDDDEVSSARTSKRASEIGFLEGLGRMWTTAWG